MLSLPIIDRKNSKELIEIVVNYNKYQVLTHFEEKYSHPNPKKWIVCEKIEQALSEATKIWTKIKNS